MIELVLAAALAAGAAVAAGGAAVVRARRTRARVRDANAHAARDERDRSDRWLDVGDAVILDEGRGDTLTIVRRVALGAAGDDPFLVLLETDGPAAARAVLAYDPLAPAALAIVRPTVVDALAALRRRPDARPPSSIELRVDGAPRGLTLAYSRRARAVSTCAEGAPLEGLLPAPEASREAPWEVASYVGASEAVALVIVAPGSEARVVAFVGARIPAERVDVLRNRGA
jgi:hypothetical protein